MESSNAPTIAKKMLRMLRVVYQMIRKGILSKQKLTMDLHLLLKRWKLAGKSIASLLAFNLHHHRHSAHYPASFSCMSMDPSQSFYNPREVEFSCSNTPSFAPFHLNKRKSRRNYEAAAAIAKAFELLGSSTTDNNEIPSDAESIPPSIAPSPMIVGFGRSPRMVRQLRITDSPYPIKEDEVADDGKVDKEADDFIRRFYEQLKIQQSAAAATPEHKLRRG